MTVGFVANDVWFFGNLSFYRNTIRVRRGRDNSGVKLQWCKSRGVLNFSANDIDIDTEQSGSVTPKLAALYCGRLRAGGGLIFTANEIRLRVHATTAPPFSLANIGDLERRLLITLAMIAFVRVHEVGGVGIVIRHNNATLDMVAPAASMSTMNGVQAMNGQILRNIARFVFESNSLFFGRASRCHSAIAVGVRCQMRDVGDVTIRHNVFDMSGVEMLPMSLFANPAIRAVLGTMASSFLKQQSAAGVIFAGRLKKEPAARLTLTNNTHIGTPQPSPSRVVSFALVSLGAPPEDTNAIARHSINISNNSFFVVRSASSSSAAASCSSAYASSSVIFSSIVRGNGEPAMSRIDSLVISHNIVRVAVAGHLVLTTLFQPQLEPGTVVQVSRNVVTASSCASSKSYYAGTAYEKGYFSYVWSDTASAPSRFIGLAVDAGTAPDGLAAPRVAFSGNVLHGGDVNFGATAALNCGEPASASTAASACLTSAQLSGNRVRGGFGAATRLVNVSAGAGVAAAASALTFVLPCNYINNKVYVTGGGECVAPTPTATRRLTRTRSRELTASRTAILPAAQPPRVSDAFLAATDGFQATSFALAGISASIVPAAGFGVGRGQAMVDFVKNARDGDCSGIDAKDGIAAADSPTQMQIGGAGNNARYYIGGAVGNVLLTAGVVILFEALGSLYLKKTGSRSYKRYFSVFARCNVAMVMFVCMSLLLAPTTAFGLVTVARPEVPMGLRIVALLFSIAFAVPTFYYACWSLFKRERLEKYKPIVRSRREVEAQTFVQRAFSYWIEGEGEWRIPARANEQQNLEFDAATPMIDGYHNGAANFGFVEFVVQVGLAVGPFLAQLVPVKKSCVTLAVVLCVVYGAFLVMCLWLRPFQERMLRIAMPIVTVFQMVVVIIAAYYAQRQPPWIESLAAVTVSMQTAVVLLVVVMSLGPLTKPILRAWRRLRQHQARSAADGGNRSTAQKRFSLRDMLRDDGGGGRNRGHEDDAVELRSSRRWTRRENLRQQPHDPRSHFQHHHDLHYQRRLQQRSSERQRPNSSSSSSSSRRHQTADDDDDDHRRDASPPASDRYRRQQQQYQRGRPQQR